MKDKLVPPMYKKSPCLYCRCSPGGAAPLPLPVLTPPLGAVINHLGHLPRVIYLGSALLLLVLTPLRRLDQFVTVEGDIGVPLGKKYKHVSAWLVSQGESCLCA